MSRHTPGPWWADGSRYGTIYVEANAVIDKRVVQEVCAVGPTESGREQQEANASLIAAAPELLEALRPMVEGTAYITAAHVAAARAAIAKATGETV